MQDSERIQDGALWKCMKTFLAVCYDVMINYLYCKHFSDLCRSLKFTTPLEGHVLVGHVIKNLSIGLHASCKHLCTMESQCVSFNIGPSTNAKMLCQLSDSDHNTHSEDLKPKEGFIYRATQVRNSITVLCWKSAYLISPILLFKHYSVSVEELSEIWCSENKY